MNDAHDNEKEIYKGPIFTLVQRQVTIHDKQYQRDIIMHPGGVSLLVLKEDKILLVKQFRSAIEEETIEIPAGKLEYGENPEICALRELNEETGYTTDKLEFIQKINTIPAYCTETVYLYQAKDVYKAKKRLDMDEDEEIEEYWVPLTEAYKMTQNGQIIDAKTIIAIHHAIIQRKGDAE